MAIVAVGCGGASEQITGSLTDAVKSVAKNNVAKTLGLGGLNRQMAGFGRPGSFIGGTSGGGGGSDFGGGWFGDFRIIAGAFGLNTPASREVTEETGFLDYMNLYYKLTNDSDTGSYRYELFEDKDMTISAGFREYKLETPVGTWPQRWTSSYRWQDFGCYAEPVEVKLDDQGGTTGSGGFAPPQGERIWREGTSTTIIDDENYSSGSSVGTYSASNGEKSTYEYSYSATSWTGRDEFTDAEGHVFTNQSSGNADGTSTSSWSNPDSRGEVTFHSDGTGEGTMWDGKGNLVCTVVWSADGVITIRYADGTVEVIDYRMGYDEPKDDAGGDSGGTTGSGGGTDPSDDKR